MKLSFLDFSSQAKRKYFVEQELLLNQRLAPKVYLRALPVYLHAGRYRIGGTEGELVDHALEMKRLDNALEMDVRLAQGKVGRTDIDDPGGPRSRSTGMRRSSGARYGCGTVGGFRGRGAIQRFCTSTLGEERGADLGASLTYVEAFLAEQAALIEQRDRGVSSAMYTATCMQATSSSLSHRPFSTASNSARTSGRSTC